MKARAKSKTKVYVAIGVVIAAVIAGVTVSLTINSNSAGLKNTAPESITIEGLKVGTAGLRSELNK